MDAAKHERPKQRRDERLWALLPPKAIPYDYRSLSQVETDALVEALSDGFGDMYAKDAEAMPVPSELMTGLLDHRFYCCKNSEYESQEWDEAFWTRNCEYLPSPSENFPLGFQQRRLRIYFQNQFDRFCLQQAREHEQFREQQVREDPALPSFNHSEDIRWIFEDQAYGMLYEKPWYERHALRFLDFIEQSEKELSKYPALAYLTICSFAGKLGRLVEQYDWRFRFERAAITGSAARKGASAGGRAKAGLHQAEQSAWQNAASKIWARRPALSKIAVAERVRKELGEVRTAKHIARYIIQP